MSLLHKFVSPVSVAIVLLASTNCNIYDPIDNPGNDEQYLSAGRACFDQGDIPCAMENYGKVTGADKEIAIAETAFAILHDAGLTMSNFMSAMSDGNASKGLAKVAGELSRVTEDPVKLAEMRGKMFTAYEKTKEITRSGEIRGLVRFMSAFAIASAVLAEDAPLNERFKFERIDIVSNPDVCAISGACGATPGARIMLAPTPAAMTNALVTANPPNWGIFNWAMKEIDKAFGAAELGVGGKFGSGTGSFAGSVKDSPYGDSDNAQYRRALSIYKLGL